MSVIHIGTSGWRYAPWRGAFYPEGLPQRQELAYAARQFSSVEINGTFYSLQRPEIFQRWADEVPDDKALKRWAAAITAWAAGTQPADAARIASYRPAKRRRDAFCYFDNDRKVRAPADARRLMQMLQLNWAAQHAA